MAEDLCSITDIKKDTYIYLEYGEYEDKQNIGLYRVLQDFNAVALLEQFAKEKGAPYTPGAFMRKLKVGHSPKAFADWLEFNSYIDSINHTNIHLGDYDAVELS